MKEELIVFVDEDGKPTGKTGPKLASHGSDTKLHLAFSCYIFRSSDGKFLTTMRAHSKKVWPGVWTNSVCGHPAPSEAIGDAIKRRAEFELGIKELSDIECVLPNYRYKTPPFNGIVENEFCPVFIAYTDSELKSNPNEVEEYKWLSWKEYVDLLETGKNVSFWAKDQYKELSKLQTFMEKLN